MAEDIDGYAAAASGASLARNTTSAAATTAGERAAMAAAGHDGGEEGQRPAAARLSSLRLADEDSLEGVISDVATQARTVGFADVAETARCDDYLA